MVARRWCPGGECWLGGGCAEGGGSSEGGCPGRRVRMIREPGPAGRSPFGVWADREPLVTALMSRMPRRRHVRPGENGSTS